MAKLNFQQPLGRVSTKAFSPEASIFLNWEQWEYLRTAQQHDEVVSVYFTLSAACLAFDFFSGCWELKNVELW